MQNEKNGLLPRLLPQLSLGILWLVSVFLTVMCIFAVHDIAVWGLGLLITQPDRVQNFQAVDMINMVGQCSTVILGVIAMIVLIYTTEAVFRGTEKARTTHNLIKLIAVEAVIVVPAVLFISG